MAGVAPSALASTAPVSAAAGNEALAMSSRREVAASSRLMSVVKLFMLPWAGGRHVSAVVVVVVVAVVAVVVVVSVVVVAAWKTRQLREDVERDASTSEFWRAMDGTIAR